MSKSVKQIQKVKLNNTKQISKKAATTKKSSKVAKGSKFKFSWKKVKISDRKTIPLARSSHGLSTHKDTVYVFGGEHVPRTAIDSTIHALTYKEDTNGEIAG
jgi:hypothetical protein